MIGTRHVDQPETAVPGQVRQVGAFVCRSEQDKLPTPRNWIPVICKPGAIMCCRNERFDPIGIPFAETVQLGHLDNPSARCLFDRYLGIRSNLQLVGEPVTIRTQGFQQS